MRDLFRDSTQTEFVIATIPTVMAVNESMRLLQELRLEGVPVRCVTLPLSAVQFTVRCKSHQGERWEMSSRARQGSSRGQRRYGAWGGKRTHAVASQLGASGLRSDALRVVWVRRRRMVVNQLMPPLDDDMKTIPAEVVDQLKALDAQHSTHLQVTPHL